MAQNFWHNIGPSSGRPTAKLCVWDACSTARLCIFGVGQPQNTLATSEWRCFMGGLKSNRPDNLHTVKPFGAVSVGAGSSAPLSVAQLVTSNANFARVFSPGRRQRSLKIFSRPQLTTFGCEQ